MLRHTKNFALALALALGLLAGTSTAQADKTHKLFRPDQPPLSETGAVRAAKNQIDKLERVRNAGKNYVRSASRRNSDLVANLNERRAKRNKERAQFLDRKLAEYKNELFDPIGRRYDQAVDRAKVEYKRDVQRIRNGNDKGAKRRAALKRALENRRTRLANAADARTADLRRANDLYSRTRSENFSYYKKISVREKAEVKALKQKLRKALADLRKNSR